MRITKITKVFNKLLCLQSARVLGVDFRTDALVIFVEVEIRGGLVCSRCRRGTRRGSYDSKERLWRHLDLGPWEVYLRAQLRRFHCRHCNKVVTQAVPWAEPSSTFTRDFEDLTSFFAQQANQTVVSRVMNIAWPTVGNIIQRTVKQRGIPLQRRKLYKIGIDEISYRKHHKYLSIVADHVSGQVVWGGDGKAGKALDPFLDAIGEEGRKRIELVSMDMSKAYISKVRERLPHATIVFDPFHVIKLANNAIDEVRRSMVRGLKGTEQARAVKNLHWLLLKAEENLLPEEVERLSAVSRLNRPLFRAYLLKETLRDVYREHPDLAPERLDDWLAWASRSRLPAFVKLARTVREHRQGILAAIKHQLSNARLEGINSKIRLLSHRACGFHSPEALLAFVYLCCSGIQVPVPSDRRPGHDPYLLLAS